MLLLINLTLDTMEKVFVEGKDDTANYEEINNVGEGKIDLTNDNNLQGDVVYIDLRYFIQRLYEI